MIHISVSPGENERSSSKLMFYDLQSCSTFSEVSNPQLEVPRDDIEVRFSSEVILVESLMTAEDDRRVNCWMFLDYSGDKLGSFIYESRSERLLTENKSSTYFSPGHLTKD